MGTISNEQKAAAFDGIMRLVGAHALGEWYSECVVPEYPIPILMICAGNKNHSYLTGFFISGKYYDHNDNEVEMKVVCWKYDDAENIVKLLKF